MTTINNGTTGGISNELLATMNGTKKSAKSVAAEAQDKFMTLLVTQMKNQDPLNPLDNAQVTSQLAQLSTVTGIDKLNTTLEALMGSYQSSQSLQATGMIGREVMVPGTGLNLANGRAPFGLELAQPVDKMSVKILNGAGLEIHSIELGPQEAGTHAFEWNGQLGDGTTVRDGAYSFQLVGMRGADKVEATGLSMGRVSSVSTGNGSVKVNIPGMDAVNLADVRRIL